MADQKTLNGIQWEVAHPLSLNYRGLIASMDATICPRTYSTSLDKLPYGAGVFICYRQPVLIYSGKPNNVDKTDEDLPWWP